MVYPYIKFFGWVICNDDLYFGSMVGKLKIFFKITGARNQHISIDLVMNTEEETEA